MELRKALEQRRSYRRFDDSPVTREIILKLIAAACSAPSAGNVQSWRFYVVTSREKKDGLAAAALGQTFITRAGAVIIVCSDLAEIGAQYGSRGKELYSIQETAAATQNLLLAAMEEGLGTCWVGAFDEEEIAKVLGLHFNERPLVIIPVGKASGPPRSIEKKSPQSVTKFVD